MTEIHAFDPDGTPSPGALIALNNYVANGGVAGTGIDSIVAVSQEEYDALTPDPRTLYVVVGGTAPPIDPEEPGTPGTKAAPVIGEPVYAGNHTSASSITIDRPDDLLAGDLLVVALRSQDGSSAFGWSAPEGFVAAFNEPATWPSNSNRVAGIWVKPISTLATEPASYTFTGPTGRNVGVAVKMNIGGGDVTKVATAPYGSVSYAIEEQALTGAPALSLMAMGAECTSGVSHVPSTIPSGYATLGNTQSSLDLSTSGSRTAIWLGWRYEPDAIVEGLNGGFAGASAVGLYYGAITGGV